MRNFSSYTQTQAYNYRGVLINSILVLKFMDMHDTFQILQTSFQAMIQCTTRSSELQVVSLECLPLTGQQLFFFPSRGQDEMINVSNYHILQLSSNEMQCQSGTFVFLTGSMLLIQIYYNGYLLNMYFNEQLLFNYGDQQLTKQGRAILRTVVCLYVL